MIGRLLPFRRVREYAGVADDQLVLASAKGDATALEELFARHSERVYRILCRLRGVDAKGVEHLLQSTFLEVQRSAWRFENRAPVLAWIVGIALNLRRHHLRSEPRRHAFMGALGPLADAADRRGPEEQLADRQSLDRLEAAVHALPERLRVVLILTDLEGLKGKDAARALNLPEWTLWRRLHEARLWLREALATTGER